MLLAFSCLLIHELQDHEAPSQSDSSEGMASQSAGRIARYANVPDDNAIEIKLITRVKTNAVLKGKEDFGTSVSWQKA
jgi:hypothetical protein